jgi:hypothetical protein
MASEFTTAIASAVQVRVDVEEQTDRKRRRQRQPLIETVDRNVIARLAEALTCDHCDEDVNLMMWPTLVITLQGIAPQMVIRVGYLHPGWLRQESWGQDRRLTTPEALPTLLAELGWTPP